jgi:hypothetical protein
MKKRGKRKEVKKVKGAILVRGVSPEEHARAKARAARSERTLSWVIRTALREYGAGTWTPTERK